MRKAIPAFQKTLRWELESTTQVPLGETLSRGRLPRVLEPPDCLSARTGDRTRGKQCLSGGKQPAHSGYDRRICVETREPQGRDPGSG